MPGNRRRVLVTRPEPGASETAGRLVELGLLPIKLPLQETSALPVADAAVPDGATTVAITSANAIRHAPGELIQRLKNLPCFAVGEATAAAAQSAGFIDVTETGGDSTTLGGTISAMHPSGPVIYLCGRIRRPVFEQRLTVAGVEVAAIETYGTARLVHTVREVADAVGTEPVDAALLYSANAAAALAETLGQPGLEKLFEGTIFLCLSQRIAAALAETAKERILTAAEPSETALLALIHHVGRRAP
jgi:uroporphyrinogen-III synthase